MIFTSFLVLASARAANPTFDTGFSPNPNSTVRAIAVQPSDNKVIFGGDFTGAGGATRTRIARVDANGTLDGNFCPSFNSTVYALAVQSDGKILVGGSFLSVNGYSKAYFVRLNTDGTPDSSFPYSGSPNGPVYAITQQADQKILIAGSFTYIGNTPRKNVARYAANGVLDSNFATSPDGPVYAVSVNASNRVAIAGTFNWVGVYQRQNIAVLNSDGAVNSTFAPNPGANYVVHSIFYDDAGAAQMAGGFTQINGTLHNYTATLDSSGVLPISGGLANNLNNSAKVIIPHSSYGYLVGGYFTAAASLTRKYICAFSGGVPIQEVDFGDISGSSVQAIAVDSNGKILIGGDFVTVHGYGRYNLARFTP